MTMMTLLIVTAVLGMWVALSLLGNETQRQKQNLELAERIAARRAAQQAANEAAQAAADAQMSRHKPRAG
jgi:heme O synthase-like polyprenyltransferase